MCRAEVRRDTNEDKTFQLIDEQEILDAAIIRI